MSALVWPTHKAKASARRKARHARKNRRQRMLRLHRDGKRGVIDRGGFV